MNNLEFAFAMEREGEQYYLKQAELYKDNEGLRNVCILMAKDERVHANIIDDLLHNVRNKLSDRDFLSEVKSIFKDAPDVNIKSDSVNKELDFYKEALLKEQESINLYKELKVKAETVEEKAIFEFLISQEEDHCHLITELINFLEKNGTLPEASEYGFSCNIK
ncbi:MAG: ferritin family protein [Fusobacteria bacterium]|nr:ferritin family protein [Fusobacteriota bacterium]